MDVDEFIVVGAVAISTAVIFAYLVFIWWMDRYKRQPLRLVLIAFAWGGLGATALGCGATMVVAVPVREWVAPALADLIVVVAAGPILEEMAKGLIFGALVWLSRLDNETDGLIYGAATGLGFAAVENVVYFTATFAAGPEVFWWTVVIRTLFTSMMHAISTALLGYAVGYVQHRELWPRLWLLPFVGFALAAINHGMWNGLVFLSGSDFLSDQLATEALGLGLLFVFLMAVATFVITQLSLMREQKIIEEYLYDEAQRGTLPKEHAEIVPSWRRRRKKGWLPPEVPHRDYVEAATLLAFRRYQRDTATEAYRKHYEEEVKTHRARVRRMLALATGGQ